MITHASEASKKADLTSKHFPPMNHLNMFIELLRNRRFIFTFGTPIYFFSMFFIEMSF